MYIMPACLDSLTGQTRECVLCSECKQTVMGQEYMGTVSATVNGRTCQPWSSNSPHEPNALSSDDANYPDGSRAAAVNYCRNPDGGPEGPWCYTMDQSVRFEYCNVPLCSATEGRYKYMLCYEKHRFKTKKN